MNTTVYAFAWGFGPARWTYSRKAARYERERIAKVNEVSNAVSAVWSLPLNDVLEDPNRYLYVGDLNWN